MHAKYVGWIIAAMILLALTFGQSDNQRHKSDLTWEELKHQQNAERLDFLAAQKESLGKALEEQKSEMTSLVNGSGNLAGDGLKLGMQHSDERREIMKAQSDERAKEAEIWAAERKAYFSGS